jgi:DNA topoisomerase IA
MNCRRPLEENPAGLSAGRVQSVAVRLIVEREREIENFTAAFSFKITAEFTAGDVQARAAHPLQDRSPRPGNSSTDSSRAVHRRQRRDQARHSQARRAVHHLHPAAGSQPQARLQRPANHGPRPALYEAGKITYMRTDSVTCPTLPSKPPPSNQEGIRRPVLPGAPVHHQDRRRPGGSRGHPPHAF